MIPSIAKYKFEFTFLNIVFNENGINNNPININGINNKLNEPPIKLSIIT